MLTTAAHTFEPPESIEGGIINRRLPPVNSRVGPSGGETATGPGKFPAGFPVILLAVPGSIAHDQSARRDSRRDATTWQCGVSLEFSLQAEEFGPQAGGGRHRLMRTG
jgi:hypothetical protein